MSRTSRPAPPSAHPGEALTTRSTLFVPQAAGYPDLMGHHRHLVEDQARTGAFVEALERVVRPGCVVADLGAGTGILSLVAARAGARKVYALELRESMLQVAREVAAANGLSERLVFVPGHSKDARLPEPVDVIVSECMGVLAICGTMIQAVADLRDRHLAPGGAVVPGRLSVHVAPVELPESHQYASFWQAPHHGFDWAPAHRLAVHNIYMATVEPGNLLAAPGRALEIDLTSGNFDGRFDAAFDFTAGRSGHLHGFAGWFDARLCDGVLLSTSPDSARTVWRQVFFPLAEPVEVHEGAPIRLRIGSEPSMIPGHFLYLDWRTEVEAASGTRRFDQSTRYSYPGRKP